MDNYMDPQERDDSLEEDSFVEKIPNRYKDLYDSDDFEKFTHRKEYDS